MLFYKNAIWSTTTIHFITFGDSHISNQRSIKKMYKHFRVDCGYKNISLLIRMIMRVNCIVIAIANTKPVLIFQSVFVHVKINIPSNWWVLISTQLVEKLIDIDLLVFAAKNCSIWKIKIN